MGLCVLGLWFFVRYIKDEYRKYDREETQKEEIERLKGLIKGAMNYIYTNFNNDFDSSAYNNIKIKVDFLRPIIERKPTEKKLYYYKKLFQRLYETTYRLKTDFYNVKSVISPLTTLVDEIAAEQIDYIRENSDI